MVKIPVDESRLLTTNSYLHCSSSFLGFSLLFFCVPAFPNAVNEAAELTARRHVASFSWLSANAEIGHTLGCFLMALHTCRGYEQGGYQYHRVNTFSSNTDISLCTSSPPPPTPQRPPPPTPAKPAESLYWSQCLGFAPIVDSNVTVSPMFL